MILRRDGEPESPRPVRVAQPEGTSAIVEIPAEYQELRDRDPELALAWRDAVADAVEACLASGMFAGAFARDRACYVFGRERVRGDIPA